MALPDAAQPRPYDLAGWACALQGAFASDTRGMAAGVVMTVVPILIFFIALQRQFINGLTGAVLKDKRKEKRSYLTL